MVRFVTQSQLTWTLWIGFHVSVCIIYSAKIIYVNEKLKYKPRKKCESFVRCKEKEREKKKGNDLTKYSKLSWAYAICSLGLWWNTTETSARCHSVVKIFQCLTLHLFTRNQIHHENPVAGNHVKFSVNDLCWMATSMLQNLRIKYGGCMSISSIFSHCDFLLLACLLACWCLFLFVVVDIFCCLNTI